MSEMVMTHSVEETMKIQTIKLNQQLNMLLEQNTRILELEAECKSLTAQLWWCQNVHPDGSDYQEILQSKLLNQIHYSAITDAADKMGDAFILPANLRRETQKAEFYKAGWRDAFLFLKQYAGSIAGKG